jgi:hypothetical protein
VVHHIGRRGLEDLERAIQPPAKIRHQHLDLGDGRQLAHLADAVDEVTGAAVFQVIAVHGSDDDVGQLQRARQVERLFNVKRIGPPVRHVAERAAARAAIAHDHEGRRALAEALADVGAARLLAHRVQAVLAQNVLDLIEARGRRTGLNPNPVGLAQTGARLARVHDLDREFLEHHTGLGVALFLRRHGGECGLTGRGGRLLRGRHGLHVKTQAGRTQAGRTQARGARWDARRSTRRSATSSQRASTPSVAKSIVGKPA